MASQPKPRVADSLLVKGAPSKDKNEKSSFYFKKLKRTFRGL